MRTTLRKGIGFVMGALLIAPLNLAAAECTSAIDELVKSFLKDKPYLGLVVGITRKEGHKVLGYGEVTLEGKQRVPAGDTIFEIGSITKVFTGTLLADQVLAGSVRLDDAVQKHLPEGFTVPRRDGRDITLLHLATHTSSLPVQPPFIGLFALTSKDPGNPYAEYDQKHLKETLATIKLWRPIGSQFEYSNLGVGLLGHALAHAAKTNSYEDLMVQRLARPLGLNDTRIKLSAEQNKRLAPGHASNGKPASPWTFACLEACGGLRSTAEDLLALVDADLGLRKSSLTAAFQMAHEPWRETGHGSGFVGLCWMRQKLTRANRTMLWHNGGTGGYRSFLGLMPDPGIGIVILSNSPHSVDALGDGILQLLDKKE